MSTQSTALPEGSVTASGEIVRYTYKERLCHWTNGVTYVFCLCTGLAFYSPYLYWLSFVGGGPSSSRLLHPWVGVFFYLAVVWMHTMWKHQMGAIPEDQQWKDKLRDYIDNNDSALPPQGRFNAGQKLFYWTMYYGALFLLVTGILMWFPEKWRGLHGLMAYIIPLHTIAALATIAAFIIHLYMGLMMVRGGLKGITQGTVSKAWAQHHHRLWYDKIKQKNN